MDLQQLFDRLLASYGPRHWWPAQTPFEMALGAFLTQNTAWTNVERAIDALRAADALTPAGIAALADGRLEALIRPAGYFNQKADRIRRFVAHLQQRHGGSLERLLAGEPAALRVELLALKGVGPETADSILLYAGGHPSFVVDAYTRRLGERIGFLDGTEGYETVRQYFMQRLPAAAPLFNEYHALIVEHAKVRCRKRAPLCADCPLRRDCRYGKSQS